MHWDRVMMIAAGACFGWSGSVWFQGAHYIAAAVWLTGVGLLVTCNHLFGDEAHHAPVDKNDSLT